MLLDPLVFRNGVRARNRAWLAPMATQQSAEDGSLTDEDLRWLEMRARGGFGVVETGAAHVALDGQAWPGELGVFDDRLLPGLRRLASALAHHGSLGVVQIFHGGLHAPRKLTGETAWSASAYEAPGMERAQPATEEDSTRVMGQFRGAAERCNEAGFAGVAETNPFQIISGFSAGAINGVWLAAHGESFDTVTQNMWNAWAHLTVQQIYEANAMKLIGLGSRWLKELSFGGFLGESKMTFLLDTSPLASFLSSHINFNAIQKQILTGNLYAISTSATDYKTGRSVTFFEGASDIQPWLRANRIGKPARVGVDHVMASASIPIFFPPVEIDKAYYGDGMIRLNAPLSSVIHMGAERILFVGMQGPAPSVLEQIQVRTRRRNFQSETFSAPYSRDSSLIPLKPI